MYLKIAVILLISILFTACDGGLDPTQTKEVTGYIKGNLHFKSNWPPTDSVKDIRVVAFKNYPPVGILEEILGGNAYYTMESLPFFVDSTAFTIEIPEPPLTVKYLVVAQQYGGMMEWRAVGVLNNGDITKPAEFTINKGEKKYYDIDVDFNNLPPQPFKK